MNYKQYRNRTAQLRRQGYTFAWSIVPLELDKDSTHTVSYKHASGASVVFRAQANVPLAQRTYTEQGNDAHWNLQA